MSEFAEETTDFLAYIKADLEALKKSRDEAIKAVNEALEYLQKNDIFVPGSEINEYISHVHQKMDIYVKQQMKLESYKQQQQQQQQQQPAPEQQKSWWQKISQTFSKPPARDTTHPYLASDLQEKVGQFRKQYEAYHALLKYQNTPERRDEILGHWRSTLSHTLVEISNYVQASYQIEEEKLRALREELTRSWVGSETVVRGNGERNQS
jgi:hypothetical protein